MIFFIALAMLTGCATGGKPPLPPPKNAREVAERCLQAYGGTDKFASIKSWTFKGEINDVDGNRMPFRFYSKEGDKLRLELTISGKTIILASDGKRYWNINPMSGITKAEPMPKQGIEQAEQVLRLIKGPLMGYESDSLSLSLSSDTIFNGKPYFDLVMASKDADTMHLYIDKNEFFIDRARQKASYKGHDTEIEMFFKERIVASGYIISTLTELRSGGNMGAYTRIFDILADTDVPDSMFEMP